MAKKPIDYTSFGPNGPTRESEPTLDKRWWRVKKSERAGAIITVVGSLANNDGRRQQQYQDSVRMYGNSTLRGSANVAPKEGVTAAGDRRKTRLTYNIVQACVDTVTAKITKNKPRPMFLTSGGDTQLQKKAKALTKFVDGVFYENNAYKLGTKSFVDSAVIGDGMTQVYEKHDRVCFERALPSELYVDPLEAFYGNPRQLHRVKPVDREVLLEMYPEHRAAILEAKEIVVTDPVTNQNVSDQITTIESWHLPSGPDAKDGMHCIVIDGATILEEEWEHDVFPFAKLPWCERMYGYWAQGGAEQVQSIQIEISKILWVIQRSLHLIGTFKIWMRSGTKTPKEHFTNEIGSIIMGTEPPQYLLPPAVPPEMYQQFDRLVQRGFEQFGISQLSANSQKPAGLNSGKALREFNDIESERYMTIGHQYEDYYLQLAKLSIMTAKKIFAKNKDYEVKVPGKRFVETINWKDIDLEKDQYVMKCFPTSSLPEEPAGRLQTVQEYVQAGMMAPRTARKLLDFPDLDAVESLENASEEYLSKILDQMVEDGIPTAPEPQDDLALAQQMALEYYAKGKLNDLEEEKLDLLRQFMTQVQALQAGATQAAQAQAMAAQGAPGMGQPQANPTAAPQSDLIQNTPQAMAG